MRKLLLPALALGLLAGLTACSGPKAPDAADKNKKKDGPTILRVGDPAPPLKAVEWRNGPAVGSLQEGKVYVLEFWATWCGPCIQAMPHLAALQAEYRDQGLVVLPVTTLDARNSKAEVEAFVKERGPKLGLTFALFDTEETDGDYRKAAGIEGIPASFVIDRHGKIAYIGRPTDLDDVLPKVLAGTWGGVEEADRVTKMAEEYRLILQLSAGAPDKAVKELEQFEAKYPGKVTQPAYLADKVSVLIQAKEYDKAKAATEAVLPRLVARKNAHLLAQIRDPWVNPQTNPGKAHADLAVKVADAALAADPTEPAGYYYAAAAHANVGDGPRAVELAREAVQKAPDEDTKHEFQVGQMAILLEVRRPEEAAELAKTLIPQLAARQNDRALLGVQSVWAGEKSNPTRAHLELAVQAADALLALTGRDSDPDTLRRAAETYFATGNKAKAAELARKALQHTDDPQMAEYIRKQIRRYEQ